MPAPQSRHHRCKHHPGRSGGNERNPHHPDGSELKVLLADNGGVTAIVKASLSDIKQGSFVGVAGMPRADGSQKAIEVLIFPEAMRGTGEGHYPWDVRPQSTMTNANVEQSVTGVDGQALTLKYKDGEKKIIVPPEAPIVAPTPGDKGDLKPGVENLHRCGQKAGRWVVASSAYQLRQGWSHAADVTCMRRHQRIGPKRADEVIE